MNAVLPLLAAITVAYPRADAPLPSVARAYVIGAVEPGVTNVFVDGRAVPVYRTGAWATTVPVTSGVNRLVVETRVGDAGETTNVRFRVAAPAGASTSPPAKPRVYGPLACAAKELRPHPRGKAPAETVVWLDAGHGGPKDLGCRSPHDRKEKSANLLLAEAVRAALTNLGYVVRMTRDDDRAIPLYARPVAAHGGAADAFVSLHHNAPAADADVANVRYSAVYAWSDAGHALASAIAARLGAATDVPSKGALRANYAVTRSPEIPSCLVEADFLTHPAGEEAAFDAVRRRRVAEAIAAGIRDWHLAAPDAKCGIITNGKSANKEDKRNGQD